MIEVKYVSGPDEPTPQINLSGDEMELTTNAAILTAGVRTYIRETPTAPGRNLNILFKISTQRIDDLIPAIRADLERDIPGVEVRASTYHLDAGVFSTDDVYARIKIPHGSEASSL